MNTFASIAPTFIAIAALFISYRVFIRQTTFDNENHFFIYKLEQYNKIIRKAVNLQELYYHTFNWMKTGIEQRDIDIEELNTRADGIDKETERFRVILKKNSVFLPKNILHKLDNFYDQLYDESDKLEEGPITLKLMEIGVEKLDTLESELDDIINLVRTDLGIETIDRRLKVRIGKTRS